MLVAPSSTLPWTSDDSMSGCFTSDDSGSWVGGAPVCGAGIDVLSARPGKHVSAPRLVPVPQLMCGRQLTVAVVLLSTNDLLAAAWRSSACVGNSSCAVRRAVCRCHASEAAMLSGQGRESRTLAWGADRRKKVAMLAA